MSKRDYEKSSGNVFTDVGIENSEQAAAKAELARRIASVITNRKLTRAKAAELLDLDEPNVSALLRGSLGGFSMERLFKFLAALGQDVEIVVKPAKAVGRAQLTVKAARG